MAITERQAQLAATARDFASAMTPPGWIYWDPELYARDVAEIFGHMWLCVGHQSRIRDPGEFFVFDVGWESIIVVTDASGVTRAFFNVCRHRGTRIVSESSGKCRGFLCPYHAWNYDLDGSLRAAPMMDDTEGFARGDYPLRQVRLENFMGFLFINLDPDAPPVTESFADFPDLQRFDLPNLERVGHHDYQVDTNWKLVCENYHECYHCASAHPQLHRISDYGTLPANDVGGENYIGGPMAIKPRFNTMTLSGITERQTLPGCTEADQRMVHYFNLLPNFLLSICPDYVLSHTIRPRGPEQVIIETEWFCSKEQMQQTGFDPSDAIEFWDTTNKQDWKLCTDALRGLKSAGHRPGRYQSGENCAHRFDRWYIEKMFDGVLD